MATTQIAKDVYLDATVNPSESSPAVDTTGASLVRVTYVISSAAGTGNFSVMIQGSNDQGNWFPLDSSTPAQIANGTLTFPAVGSPLSIEGFAYVRVVWVTTSAAEGVVNATLNLSV